MAARLTGQGLREVMRHVPSPVTIVTFQTPGGAKGITIGSFTSVSLEPPLISFNVMLDSTAHDLLLKAENFAVQILRETQVDLSERFSIPDQSSKEQFDKVVHYLDADSIPVLDDVLAILKCRPFNIIPAGDHSLIIGEVLQVDVFEPGKPLLYYQQSYRTIGNKFDAVE